MSEDMSCVAGEFSKALLNAVDNRPEPPRVHISAGSVSVTVRGRTASGKPLSLGSNFYHTYPTAHAQTNTVEHGVSVDWGKGQVGQTTHTKSRSDNSHQTPLTIKGDGAELMEAQAAFDKINTALLRAPARCGLD